MGDGVVYVATGARYRRECAFSARSLKRHNPDLPITVFADAPPGGPRLFDEVVLLADAGKHSRQVKVQCLERSPYERTLFLDADTQVLAPIRDVFDWLDEHDLAVARGPHVDWSHVPPRLLAVEGSHYNTGVIAYRRSPAFLRFWRQWLDDLSAQDPATPPLKGDQHFFNRLLWCGHASAKDLKLRVLPNRIYNMREVMAAAMRREGSLADARILHTHGQDPAARFWWWGLAVGWAERLRRR